MIRHLRSLVLTVGFFFAIALPAQNLNITSVSPDLTVCGDADTFRVTLSNFTSDTLQNVLITAINHRGVNYVPGSVRGPGFGLNEFNISDPDSVIFSAFDIDPFSSISFYYLARAGCSSIDTAAISNGILVNHSQGSDSVGSAPYNLLIPSLSISQISPSSFSGSIGQTFTRCVDVVNGGFGALNQFFIAMEVDTNQLGYSNLVLQANGSPLPFLWQNDSLIVFIGGIQISQVGDGDGSLEQNEVLTICYDVTIKDCDALAPQPHHAYWGCNTDFCQTHTTTAEVTIPVAVPNLTRSVIYNQATCYDNTTESITKVVFTNTGAGPARDVVIEVWQGNPNGVSAGYISRFDTSRVQWVDTAGNVQFLTPTGVTFNNSSGNYACLGPNPVNRFLVTIPFIEAGEQDTLIFYQMACCKAWCGSSPTTAHRTFFQVDYEDQCKTQNYAIAATIVTSWNFGRVISMTAQGPPDMVAGDTATFSLEHSNFRFYNDAPGAYAIVDLILPPTLRFPGQPGDLFYEDVQGDLWNPVSVTVIGDTVRARFDLPQPPGFSLEKALLKVNLRADCSGGPCTSGPVTVDYNLYQVPDTTCSCRALITCRTFGTTVHCGICPATCPNGGLIFTGFDAYRENYGLPDNDNDGIPDGTGVIDMALVRTQHLMLGDTLFTRFYGFVDTVSGIPNWNAGTATTTVGRGNNLTPISHDLEIFDLSSGATYTVPLAAPTVAGTNPRTWTYTWDSTSIAPFVAPGYVFEEGDTLWLTARYRLSRNPGSIVEAHTLTNTFELENTHLGTTGSCDNYSGNMVYVGYYYTSYGPDQRAADGCGTVQVFENYYLSIGNCCSNYGGGNMFEYEYRHWGHVGQGRVVIPPGYSFSSATFSFVRTAGTQSTSSSSVPVTPVAVNGDTLVFDLASEFVDSGGTLPMGDDGWHGTLRVYLLPGCGVEPDINQAVRYLYDFSPIPALTGTGSVNPFRSSRDSLTYEGPELDLSAALQIVSGVDSSVSWDFLMQNNSNSSNGDNAWFAVTSPSGQVVPIGVTDIVSGLPVTPTGGIYQVGALPADSSRQFRIEATYANCSLDSLIILSGWDCTGYPPNLSSLICPPDTFVLYVEPAPSEIQAVLTLPSGPFDICDSIPVEVRVTSSQLASVQDVLVGVRFPVSGGLQYVNGTTELEYPDTTGFGTVADPVGPAGSKLWVINNINAVIDANNLPGIAKPDSNTFTLRFYINSNCNFISGERVVVNVRGRRVCGDLLPVTTLISSPIDINGAVTSYSTIVQAQNTTVNACPDQRTIRVAVTNAGSGSTNANDSIFAGLPNNYAYAGNFNPIHNAPPVINPAQQVNPGGTQVGWELPSTVAPGDSIVFEFDIIVGPEVACGNDLVNIQTVVNSNLFCSATSSFCNSAIQTGSQLVSVPISRAILSFSSFNSSLAPQPGGYDYTYAGQIDNAGTSIAPGTNTTVDFYCDTDGSGGYSPGDILLGNYSTTAGIPSAGSHSFNGNFFVSNANCNPPSMIFGLIVPDTSQSLCLCDTAFGNANAILPVTFLSVEGRALPAGNLVSWEVEDLSQHDYFVVEKLSTGNWRTVSRPIQGGNQPFQWLDVNYDEEEFYRVRQFDTDGTETVSQSVEVVREDGPATVEIYPNPVRGRLHVEGAKGCRLRVVDAMGKLVLETQLKENKHEIDLQGWSSGVYVFRFAKEGKTWLEKVVVE